MKSMITKTSQANGGSGTQYCFLTGDYYTSGSGSILTQYQFPASTTGTISNLRIYCTSNVSATVKFTLYKNGSATALTVTITGANSTGSDLTHSVSVAANDLLCWEQIDTGTTAFGNAYLVCDFDGTNAGESICGTSSIGVALPNSATTQYITPAGQGEPNFAVSTTANTVYAVVPTAGTIKNLYVNLGTAPSFTRTFTLYKNGSATALTFNITGSATSGNDTSHSVAVVAGDYIELVVSASGGTPLATSYNVGFCFVATNNGEFPMFAPYHGITFAAGATEYHSLNGNGPTDEASEKIVTNGATIRGIYVKLGTAPSAGKSRAFTLRKNAADQTQTCTVSDTNTTANDTAHAITTSIGDFVAYKVVSSASSTSSTTNAIGFNCYIVTAVVNTCAVSPATFTFTGQTIGEKKIVNCPVTKATFSLTGQSMGFMAKRIMTISPATFVFTGKTISTLRLLTKAISPATFTFTGGVVGTKAIYCIAITPAQFTMLGGLISFSNDTLSKFRVIKTMPLRSYYEYQPVFSSNVKDAQWTILAFGPGAKLSTSGNNSIKE